MSILSQRTTAGKLPPDHEARKRREAPIHDELHVAQLAIAELQDVRRLGLRLLGRCGVRQDEVDQGASVGLLLHFPG
jgi:hypothetical protein